MTQWRMGPQGPVGLDYTAMAEIARIVGITISEDVLLKIRMLEDDWLRKVYGMDDGLPGSRKECRHPDACAMCRKLCQQRLNAGRPDDANR